MPFPTSASSAAFLLCLALLGGCASAPQGAFTNLDSVVVLGVATRAGVEGVNRAAATRELVELAGEGGRRAVVIPSRVRTALGKQRFEALTERYAREGALEADERGWLTQARLGARFALIARVEENVDGELPVRFGAVLDADGRALSDRTAVHLSSFRRTELSVELIDLADGSSRRRRFAAEPLAHRTHTRYLGSSFSGSVAAALANRMVGGQPGHPPPPSQRATLRALLDEAVRLLPDV